MKCESERGSSSSYLQVCSTIRYIFESGGTCIEGYSINRRGMLPIGGSENHVVFLDFKSNFMAMRIWQDALGRKDIISASVDLTKESSKRIM